MEGEGNEGAPQMTPQEVITNHVDKFYRSEADTELSGEVPGPMDPTLRRERLESQIEGLKGLPVEDADTALKDAAAAVGLALKDLPDSAEKDQILAKISGLL